MNGKAHMPLNIIINATYEQRFYDSKSDVYEYLVLHDIPYRIAGIVSTTAIHATAYIYLE